MRRMNFLLTSVLCFAIAAAQIPVVDKGQIFSGDSFTVTCDLTRFSDAPNANVTKLIMQRNTSTEYTIIAIYEPFYAPEPTFTKIPTGKTWDIQFSGGTVTNNRNTIRIVMFANVSACNDAGSYKCLANFPRESTTYSSTVTTLSVSAQVNQNDIVMVPHKVPEGGGGGDEYTSYNQVGENITMTCTYTGPQNLQTAWKYSVQGLSEQPYPYTNDITDSPPQIISSSAGCTTYSYTSILSFQLQETDNEKTYFCVVQANGVERSKRNFTTIVGTPQTPDNPDSGSATSSAGPNVGAIVGGVIGGVVLLVLIIVLVYFFVIRKRKSGGDEDKRKNVESTDNKDNFTPPPVFYSKPHKPPKDESDGSRPVGMTNDALDISYDSKDLKGPPQYTNTVDDYEPPGYEKETHRGRSNKGYEEEKEEKKEGHRSRRHRDRSEDKEKEPEDKDRREDRRSRHRDRGEAEPRGRHYSTEDGTDDRYVGYGDPNMGTSI